MLYGRTARAVAASHLFHAKAEPRLGAPRFCAGALSPCAREEVQPERQPAKGNNRLCSLLWTCDLIGHICADICTFKWVDLYG